MQNDGDVGTLQRFSLRAVFAHEAYEELAKSMAQGSREAVSERRVRGLISACKVSEVGSSSNGD